MFLGGSSDLLNATGAPAHFRFGCVQEVAKQCRWNPGFGDEEPHGRFAHREIGFAKPLERRELPRVTRTIRLQFAEQRRQFFGSRISATERDETNERLLLFRGSWVGGSE